MSIQTVNSAPRLRLSRPALVLIILGALALVSVVLFMTLGAKGSWSFVLSFRGKKLLSLVLVAYSVAVSTVLFQTVTNNRILTPSIMGFDALYVLIQTGLIFTLGSASVATLDPRLLFGIEVAVMVSFSSILYRWLFSGNSRGLHLLLLVAFADYPLDGDDVHDEIRALGLPLLAEHRELDLVLEVYGRDGRSVAQRTGLA